MAIDRLGRLGLRNRMALSYLSTSVLVILLAVVLGRATGATFSSAPAVSAADQTARDSASAIAQSSSGASLSDPLPQHGNLVFPQDADVAGPIDRRALALPHIYGLRNGPASAELAVDRTGAVVATSYPSHLPMGATLARLVPTAGASLRRVLAGYPAYGETSDAGGRVAWALEPVRPGFGPPAGAVYVQIGEPATSVWNLTESDLLDILIVMVALAPVGVLFGILTMWGTVRRITGLVEASQALASGDFSRRVRPRGRDEVAALQRQFNLTAGRLQEAVGTLQELAADHARTAERERIARELHDSISQELFSLRMEIGGLEIGQAAGGTMRRRLNEVGRSLTATIRQMRVLLLELRPHPAAETAHLPAALRELAAVYRLRTGLDVRADVTVESTSLPEHVEHGLLRIAQEALANAARHSGAGSVQLALLRSDDGVELRIADDGRGFELAAVEGRGGLGLRLLRDRAAEVGGELRIDSEAGAGTRVSVTVA